MTTNRKLLIPTVKFTEVDKVKQFAGYFQAVELDLHGVKQVIDRNQRAALSVSHILMKEMGVDVHAVHLRGFDLSVNDKKLRSKATSFCNDIYSILTPKIAVLHPGKGDLPTLVSNLRFLLGKIPPELTIVIENMTHSKSALHSPETIREFVQRVEDMPSNVGVCIDTAHPLFVSMQMDGDAYTELVLTHMRAALPRLRHLHFSDRDIRDARSVKHLPIGEGMIDWQRIDAFVEEIGYDGKAVIELRYADGLDDLVVPSACRYYGCDEKDLNSGSRNTDMASVKITKEEFIEKTNLPPHIVALLNLPSHGLLEESDHFTYFIVPSSSYKPQHVDPHHALTGENDAVEWATYVFGIRKDAKQSYAVLIDKERRIGVDETVLSVYGKGFDWSDFEASFREALKLASMSKKANHIVCSMGISNVLYPKEKGAWK